MVWNAEQRDLWLRGAGDTHRAVVTSPWISPLGTIDYSGYIRSGRGIPAGTMRLLGRFAFVMVVDGTCGYRDATGVRRKLRAGDAFFVMPEVAHRYGPVPGGHWSEFHIVFGGPAFELFRNGLFDPSNPMFPLSGHHLWLNQFEEVLCSPRSIDKRGSSVVISSLISLFAQVIATRLANEAGPGEPDWLRHVIQVMEQHLSESLSLTKLAAEAGMTYDGFRKSFQAAIGESPTRYHLNKRIEAACTLLKHTQMTNKQIAHTLGFCDEYHFSSRFQTNTTLRPGSYRKKVQTMPDGT